MGNSLDLNLLKQGKHGLDINLCGGEEGFSDGFSAELLTGSFNIAVFNVKDLSDERKAV